ncbi:coiled-coil domain-containing protein 55-domain containing protein [Pterulicium gracile]|uniref:Coiled-coil domain-containing protein 55-domain containing protein n=1 Tax=Pterulicium gracile TaxID=1884261 RepID=A0A5C3QA81_9AGAR|nr:coiled-coil domain-containing protein 55-domain containing protein [Pterula gracilis]
MKLSFSLSKPSKPSVGTAPPLHKPSAFADDDDVAKDDDALGDFGDAKGKKKNNNAKLVSSAHAVASKAMRKRMDAEKKVDSTVYEYDEVWEKMQEAKQRAKEAKEVDAAVRQPKYIKGLLESAETRRLDHLRAEEAMMQKEREREGDEFADKESFVTQAYKDQMAKVRLAEEEEKKREETIKKQKGFSAGMTHFYAKLLQDDSATHEAAVLAGQRKGPIGPALPPSSDDGPNLTITKPSTQSSSSSSSALTHPAESSFVKRSDAELAKEARASGKEVELNDDNQLVDKRELLAAGLNLSAPNTRQLGRNSKRSAADANGEGQVTTHRAAGTAATRREIEARRAREIRVQMAEEEERERGEKERVERERRERVVTKRNNEEDVQSARERYLARKRAKVEETKEEDGAS